jgi:hypothetical protein
MIPVAIFVRQETLTEPSFSAIRVHNLRLEEALSSKLIVFELQVQVTEVDPNDRILGVSVTRIEIGHE